MMTWATPHVWEDAYTVGTAIPLIRRARDLWVKTNVSRHRLGASLPLSKATVLKTLSRLPGAEPLKVTLYIAGADLSGSAWIGD